MRFLLSVPVCLKTKATCRRLDEEIEAVEMTYPAEELIIHIVTAKRKERSSLKVKKTKRTKKPVPLVATVKHTKTPVGQVEITQQAVRPADKPVAEVAMTKHMPGLMSPSGWRNQQRS